MRRHLFPSIFWLVVLAPVILAEERPYRVSVIESSDKEIICDVYFDSIHVFQRQIQAVWQTSVEIPGCASTGRQGWPKLPITSLVLGIPVQGTPYLQILQQQVVSKSVTALEIVHHPEAWKEHLTAEETEEPYLHLASLWYPADAACIGLNGMLRDQRILQIELHPVRYAASQHLLQWTQSMRLRITFEGSTAAVDAPMGFTGPDAYEPALADYLANYEASKKWRSAPVRAMAKGLAMTNAAEIGWRLTVLHDGVYAVTGRELKEAGADLSGVDPRTICLTNRGRDIPILLEDHGDGVWDDEDRLVFIGEHNPGETTYRSWYSDANVYWLSWGKRTGSRMARVSGALTSADKDTVRFAPMHLHLEEDLQYHRQLASADESADHWFWMELKDKIRYTFPLSLPDAEPHSNFRLRIEMQGTTYLPASPDHKAEIQLNQQKLGVALWDNQEFKLFDSGWQDAHQLLRDNLLSIYLPADLPNVGYDRAVLNWIDFEYSGRLQAVNDSLRFKLQSSERRPVLVDHFNNDKVYVLTEQGQQIIPDRIVKQGGRYQVLFSFASSDEKKLFLVSETRLRRVDGITADAGSDLLNAGNGADYIIITHEAFKEQAERLARYRAGQGLRTMVVDVQDVYDQFNYGIYDPNAIRSFLRYAYHHYVKPAPLYVLLLGDTSHYMDKRVAVRLGFRSYLPTLMAYTSSWGMTSSDNAFVTVSGDDILPDMYIGRFPVNSPEEAAILVDKTIAYETSYSVSDWRRHLILVTGNADQFETDADELAEDYTPINVVANRLATLEKSRYYGSTQDLAEKWNQGQVLINFVGHGGGQVFEDSRLFLLEDVSRLRNKDKYAVMFSLTCFIGYFDNPESPSLSEELLRQREAGIVAHFGSAGRASMLGDRYLNIALFETIFKQGRRHIGEITTLAKFGLIKKTNGYWDTIRHFNLLGDPALRLGLAENQAAVRLERSDCHDGDTLRVTVVAKAVTNGEATITVHNENDSLISTFHQSMTQGRLTAELITFTPEIVKAWDHRWGQGSVKVYLQSGKADESGGCSFTLNHRVAAVVQTMPAAPGHNEPFYFTGRVDPSAVQEIGGVVQGEFRWSLNQITWNSLSAVQTGDGLWKSAEAVKKAEGSRIYYRLLLTGAGGKQLMSDLMQVNILSRPDLYADGSSLSLSGTEQIFLSITLKNTGSTAAGPFSVALYHGEQQMNWTPMGAPVTVKGIAAQSDTTISFPWPSGRAGLQTVWIQSDVLAQVEETNESNNITKAALRIAVPGRGTDGMVTSDQAEMFVELPSAAVASANLVTLGRRWDQKMRQSAERSSLTPLAAAGLTAPTAFFFSLSDTTLALKKESTVGVYYQRHDTTTQRFLNLDGVRLYAWNEESATWSSLVTSLDHAKGVASAKLPISRTCFALMGSADDEGPSIQVNVIGQNFVSGDVVGKQPVFTFFLQDSSGFDLSATPVTLSLDQQPVTGDQLAVTQDQETRRSLVVTYAPELSAGDHSLHISARDVNGNSSTLEITYRVAGVFEVTSLANHPNPFVRETTVAFFLQDTAEEVDLSFYTVSGRRIRSEKLHGVTGYVEWDWDGRDEDGRELANGVYYLKFVARSGDKKIERIEKLAKLE
ncbi:hypothetical protein GX408_01555 [bacterium]|nr:hypothetical protein [bacterium]